MSDKRWAAEDFDDMAKHMRDMNLNYSDYPLADDWADMAEQAAHDLRSLAVVTAQRDLLADEMRRFLPILEMLESAPKDWCKFVLGTGIPSLNGYRAALASLEQKL